MKTISVWNPKGGQGKSMLSLNLAGAANTLQLKPIIICQDPQGTSTIFANGGNLPFSVISHVPSVEPDADIVIFDHQASDWELPPCDIVVMPVKPERSQYATYADAVQRVQNAGKRIITVVTDGNMTRKNEKSTVLGLRQRGAYEIRTSVAFSRAADQYRTIFDSAFDKVNNINDRRSEVLAILTAILREHQTTEDNEQQRTA